MENPVLERGFPSESSLSHHSHADKSMILETSWFLRKSFVWGGFKRSFLCSCCSYYPCFLEILFCFEKEKLFRETRRNRQGLASSNLRYDLENQKSCKKSDKSKFPCGADRSDRDSCDMGDPPWNSLSNGARIIQIRPLTLKISLIFTYFSTVHTVFFQYQKIKMVLGLIWV